MKIAAAIMDTALLDFIGAHGSGLWAREQTVGHAPRGRTTGCGGVRTRVKIYTRLVQSPAPEMSPYDRLVVRLTKMRPC